MARRVNGLRRRLEIRRRASVQPPAAADGSIAPDFNRVDQEAAELLEQASRQPLEQSTREIRSSRHETLRSDSLRGDSLRSESLRGDSLRHDSHARHEPRHEPVRHDRSTWQRTHRARHCARPRAFSTPSSAPRGLQGPRCAIRSCSRPRPPTPIGTSRRISAATQRHRRQATASRATGLDSTGAWKRY